jgi:hypothetical protein
MRIHVIRIGTVAIKQVQRHDRTSGNLLVNILLDRNWTEPLPIFAFVIEHMATFLFIAIPDLEQSHA